MSVVLEDEARRLRLRPPVAADAEPLYAAVRESMHTVGRWMSWCHAGYALGDVKDWIARCEASWAGEGDREFGIFDAKSGEPLGCAGINQINHVHDFGNLGYWVRASRERRGVAHAAARAIARYGFAELGLARLEIVVHPDNAASRRVAEKVGARFEAIARNRLVFKARPTDAAVYALIPADIL
ncbi:MAG TPA: GNAT family N-acetyltransferase [Usitatibacter sp.]|nr:GNAT family N-acetyltransferase [Usitatibacter sp.]